MTSQQDKEALKVISSSILRMGGAVQAEILEEAGILETDNLENPDRYLFEFCSHSYWDNLGTQQLLHWNHAVVWYLTSLREKDTQDWGLASTIGDCDVDLTGSGRTYEDFEGKHFKPVSLFKFLSWVSHRLVWLNRQA